MAKRYRRVGKRTSRKSSIVRSVLRSLTLFFLRVKRAFFALRPAGRAVALSISGLALVGIGLLLVLPGKDAGAATPGEATPGIMMRSMTADSTGAEPNDVMAINIPATPSPSPTPAPTPTPDPTLQEGMEDSEEVAELQSRLMELGYLDIDEPTQHFGPATEYAVELFQRQHELQMDGVAGVQTLEMIFATDAKKYTMVEAVRGRDVENFQEQLKELGYLSKVTGYYGTDTIEAVKSFQKENGLSADGMAGEKTLELINSDSAKASPNIRKQARSKANIEKMIEAAKDQLGKKYVLGNTGPNSFDCSGLVYYCLKQAGSNRRRLNAAGYSGVSDWEKISFSDMKRGDLIFFYNNGKSKVGHVGIYMGGNEMIDASSANGKVVRRSVSTSYWKSHFVCARRPW